MDASVMQISDKNILYVVQVLVHIIISTKKLNFITFFRFQSLLEHILQYTKTLLYK